MDRHAIGCCQLSIPVTGLELCVIGLNPGDKQLSVTALNHLPCDNVLGNIVDIWHSKIRILSHIQLLKVGPVPVQKLMKTMYIESTRSKPQ